MIHSLADFPVEILRHITSLLPDFIIVKMFQIVGSRLLWAKLQNRGVHSLRLTNRITSNLALSQCLSFQGLFELSIVWTHESAVVLANVVPLLPRHLVKLHMVHPEAETAWIQKLEPEKLLDRRNFLFHYEGYTAMNFSERFPNMTHLHLQGTVWLSAWIGEHFWTYGMICLFLRLLPRGLQHLYMEHLYDITLPFYAYLPPHLTYLSARKGRFTDTRHPLTASLMQSLRHISIETLAKNLPIPIPDHLEHLEWNGSMPTVSGLPPSLLSFTYDIGYYWPLSGGINDNALALMPQCLTKLSFVSKVEVTQDAGFPPLLRSLELLTSKIWLDFSKLPRSLESLQLMHASYMAMDEQYMWKTLPPQLTRLHLTGSPELSPTTFNDLPKHLTSLTLSIQSFGYTMQLRIPSFLNLQYLALVGNFEKLIPESFIRDLPQTLHTLKLSGSVRDVAMMVPNSLTSLHVSSVIVTGLGHPLNTTKLYINPSMYFIPGCNDNVYPFLPTQPLHLPTSDPLPCTALLEDLPESLTELKFDSGGRQWGASKHILKLKKLKSLTTRAALFHNEHMEDLKQITTLESLHLFEPPSQEFVNCLPLGITRLVMEMWHPQWEIRLPSSLLTLSFRGLGFDKVYHMNRLEDLTLDTPLSIEYILQLPKSLTRLVCLYWSIDLNLDLILAILPNLTHLNIPKTATDEQLERIIASNRKVKLEMSNLIILQPLNLLELTSIKPGENIHNILKSAIAIRYPFWTGRTESETNFGKLSSFKDLFVLLPNSITRLFFNVCDLPAAFGKHLPSTLVELDVSNARGLGHTTPRFLPRSLTILRISANGFNMLSYAQLPQSLIELDLRDVHKFWPKYASSLPSSLKTLSIHVLLTSNAMIGALPRGLTSLDFSCTACTITAPALRDLPPNLTFLGGTFSMVPLDLYIEIVAQRISNFSTHHRSNGYLIIKQDIFNEMIQTNDFEKLVEHFNLPS
jgi:hypothetical protein